jgi:exodeoxyribonuclease V
MTQPQIEYSEDQLKAIELILEWIRIPKPRNPEKIEFKLGGLAGTGKTTVIRRVEELVRDSGDDFSTTPNFQHSAFTGKAVSVLRRKGIGSAMTLHSMMYRPKENKDGRVEFFKNDTLKSYDESVVDFVVVDESSMISKALYEDLLSFPLQGILWVGDPGQLEPVGEDISLMKSPDFVLQQIHRQGKESPILQFAHRCRAGDPTPNCVAGSKQELVITTKLPSSVELLANYDILITGLNVMRNKYNSVLRAVKGFIGTPICVGEKLIVTRNNNIVGVYNGQILFVDEVLQKYPRSVIVRATDETGKTYQRLELFTELLVNPKFDLNKRENRPHRETVFVDYGYCITCHKSQGSEWDRVCVIEPTWWGTPDKPMFDKKRWQYTAITRAAKQLTYVRGCR